MKTQKMKLWQWIRSFFVKKAIEKISIKSKSESTDYFEEPDWSKLRVHKDFTINEMPEKNFNNHKTFSININNKIYKLTEKQFAFYEIIKKLQFNSTSGVVSGRQIMYEFYKVKYPELSLNEIKIKIPANKFHFTNYGSTTKYLYKSGLLIKLKKNEYKVKI
jgi:hypothetical protein